MRDLIKFGLKYHTREGLPVRILTTSMKHPDYPVVALIDHGEQEEPVILTKTGCFDVDERNHPYDLIRDGGGRR